MLWKAKRIVEWKNEMQTGKSPSTGSGQERKVLIMWNKQTKLNVAIVLIAVALCMAGVSYGEAMGTAFTYQGGLNQAGEPVNGPHDFEFALYDDPNDGGGNQVGSTVTIEDANVIDGSFAVKVDFGSSVFTGDARWLEVSVRPGESSDPCDFATLSPRQELTPTPYALALPGLWTQQNATSTNLVGGYSGNSITNGVFGATIGGGGETAFPNKVADDYGTVGGGKGNQAGDDTGTTSDARCAVVGGGQSNTASGRWATIAGGYSNTASDDWATVSGGWSNTASGALASVGGGKTNEASNLYTTVGGGQSNTASGQYATVGGGYSNAANAHYVTVAGGYNNAAIGNGATVGGGSSNAASGDRATVPGGYENEASGMYSFAAGRQAKANYDGAFVWADSTVADFASTANDQFLIRASGGVGIGTTSPGDNTLYVYRGTGVVGPDYSTIYGYRFGQSGIENGGTSWSRTGVDAAVKGYSYYGNQYTAGVAGYNYLDYADSAAVVGAKYDGSYRGMLGYRDSGSKYWAGYFEGDGYFSGGVGIGTNSPAANARLTVNGAILRDGSTMYGANADTHINLGTSSTTGMNGQDYSYATVAGGDDNTASGDYATVGGGSYNKAIGYAATVGGGQGNDAISLYSTVGGGYSNDISGLNSWHTTIGGGYNNAIGDNAWYATVPGGYYNVAGGFYSFAAGRQAKANHKGAFVWADSTDADFASTANNQFLIRASGGVGIGTNNPGGFQLAVNGAAAKTGGGSWSVFSDSRLKKNIEPLDGALDRMLQLKGVSFEYRDPDHFSYVEGEQVGMVAQDIEKVFPDWVDESGGYKTVTYRGFEAITVEAFRQLRKEKDAEIAAMKERLAKMEAAISNLIKSNEGGQL